MRREELAADLERVEYCLTSASTGHLPGHHRGTFYGTAGKLKGFASLLHRMDPRNIDPVATRRALSPVPLVRLYESRVAITVAVLVDLSGSMGFEGRGRKLAEAARLCACLAYSAWRLGDRFTLVGFGDRVELHFPPRHSAEYAWEVGEAIGGHRPTARGVGGLERAMTLLPRRRSLVFLVSDFHFDLDALERALAVARRHDVVLTVLWDDAEREALPGAGWTELFDPESGARVRRWLRRGLAARLRAAFDARRTELERTAHRAGAETLLLRTPFDPLPLVHFFATRRGRVSA